MIVNHIYQVSKPETLKRDARDVELSKGVKIAFNKGGVVTIGTIINICKNDWKLRNDCRKIEQGKPKHFIRDFKMTVMDEEGQLSTIKNANSFLVI